MLLKGRTVNYQAVHYRCANCHEVFDTPQMMDQNLIAAREAYDLLENSVTPEKIISIRESYNASQKAFGLILGMGELTINSYEQGKSIPMSSNRLLLHLSENPLIFFEMYERNKNKIGEIQREKIESSQAFKKCNKWGGLEPGLGKVGFKAQELGIGIFEQCFLLLVETVSAQTMPK